MPKPGYKTATKPTPSMPPKGRIIGGNVTTKDSLPRKHSPKCKGMKG